MPVELKAKLSRQIRTTKTRWQEEKRSAVRDIGRVVRDLARKNAAKGLRQEIIETDVKESGAETYVEVGSNEKKVKWQEEGTGVYIGKGRIYPKKARVLSWQSVRGKMWAWRGGRIGTRLNVGIRQVVSGITAEDRKPVKPKGKRDAYRLFARSVRGIPPQRFLKRAVESGEARRFLATRVRVMYKRATLK